MFSVPRYFFFFFAAFFLGAFFFAAISVTHLRPFLFIHYRSPSSGQALSLGTFLKQFTSNFKTKIES
jgi:hypothetical protein